MTDAEGIASPGLLSPLLARWRHRRAELLIPEGHRAGRILDIGCGTWPAFLASTRFGEKHGLDRRPPSGEAPAGTHVVRHDLAEGRLPYPDGHFDVVTLLAVVEHLEAREAVRVLTDVRRVLRERGAAILTLPSAQGDALLEWLGRLGLTSREHHDEHEVRYDRPRLRTTLVESGFTEDRVEVGTFELGFNLWARAIR